MSGYSTNLASEFFIMSQLYRAGYDASLTLGNKKSVDITVVLAEGQAVTIDVKAVAGKDDWLLGNRPFHYAANHYVALVSYEKKFGELLSLPRVWIIPSSTLEPLVKVAGNGKTRYLSRKTITSQAEAYENGWHVLTGHSEPYVYLDC